MGQGATALSLPPINTIGFGHDQIMDSNDGLHPMLFHALPAMTNLAQNSDCACQIATQVGFDFGPDSRLTLGTAVPAAQFPLASCP